MGYSHKYVCYSEGEYSRDEDGHGFFEVYVNTMEGFCHSCGLGYGHIEGFLKKNCPYI